MGRLGVDAQIILPEWIVQGELRNDNEGGILAASTWAMKCGFGSEGPS